MSTSVAHIIELIDRLPVDDREDLERRLAERVESAWRGETELARSDADARGIDQQAIDDAVARERNGE